MNIHQCARTTPKSRAMMVHQLLHARRPAVEVAAAFSVSVRTVYKWAARGRAEGDAGLRDRPSRPHHQPRRLAAEWEAAIARLRGLRFTGPRIARCLGLPGSTVGHALRRLGLNHLPPVTPPPPVRRYTYARPGGLVHLDIKKLARIVGVGHWATGDRRDTTRGAGWEYLHVAIDDASRLAYAELLPNEQGPTAAAFWTRARAWFARHGIVQITRLLTDNGSAYRSHHLAGVLGPIRHLFTKPYTPRTNGKAERLIQTALREWAYVGVYASSAARAAALPRWLRYYNHERLHGSLAHQPPITQVQGVNNVLDNHS